MQSLKILDEMLRFYIGDDFSENDRILFNRDKGHEWNFTVKKDDVLFRGHFDADAKEGYVNVLVSENDGSEEDNYIWCAYMINDNGVCSLETVHTQDEEECGDINFKGEDGEQGIREFYATTVFGLFSAIRFLNAASVQRMLTAIELTGPTAFSPKNMTKTPQASVTASVESILEADIL